MSDGDNRLSDSVEKIGQTYGIVKQLDKRFDTFEERVTKRLDGIDGVCGDLSSKISDLEKNQEYAKGVYKGAAIISTVVTSILLIINYLLSWFSSGGK